MADVEITDDQMREGIASTTVCTVDIMDGDPVVKAGPPAGVSRYRSGDATR